MFSEIETKLKVDSLSQIEAKLTGLKAVFVEEQIQKDYYFDDSQGSLTENDKCLRLRSCISDGNEKVYFTFKGPKEVSQVKRRQEIETEIGNIDVAEKLLEAIGYSKSMVVEKKRQVWSFGGCEVALDEVLNLGSFVEIEGEDEVKIIEVQEKLGLGQSEHIIKSYACLLAEKPGH